MKKLLATLIVATMLISCMSLIVFADAPSFYTDAKFAASSAFVTYTEKKGAVKSYDDDFGAAYYDYVSNALNYPAGTAVATDSLFNAMWMACDYDDSDVEFIDNFTSFPYASKPGEYVAVPIYANNVCAYKVTASYDTDYLTLVDITCGTANVAEALTNDGVANPLNGFIGMFVFTVKDATGDAEGKATTNVTLNLALCADPDTNSLLGSVGNLTCAIDLAGLTASGGTKPEKVTGDDDTTTGAVTIGGAVTMADVSGFTAAAGDDAALLAGKANVVNNDGDPALYDGTYNIFFGKNDFSGVTTAPDKVGLALYEDGNFKGLYEAQKIINDKWGILFYGLNSSKTYSVKQYIQYDGEAAIIAE